MIKIGVSPMNHPDNGSVDCLIIIAAYDGDDSTENMEKFVVRTIKQLNEMTHLMVYTNNGSLKTARLVPVRKFLTGDLKSECSTIGHGGSSCRKSCIPCLIDKKDCETVNDYKKTDKYPPRTLASYKTMKGVPFTGVTRETHCMSTSWHIWTTSFLHRCI